MKPFFKNKNQSIMTSPLIFFFFLFYWCAVPSTSLACKSSSFSTVSSRRGRLPAGTMLADSRTGKRRNCQRSSRLESQPTSNWNSRKKYNRLKFSRRLGSSPTLSLACRQMRTTLWFLCCLAALSRPRQCTCDVTSSELPHLRISEALATEN